MAGAGYFQWFVVMPRMFSETEFHHSQSRSDKDVPKHARARQFTAVPRDQEPKRESDAIRAYDNRGRTPLERAMASTLYKCFRMKVAIFHASIAFQGNSAVV